MNQRRKGHNKPLTIVGASEKAPATQASPALTAITISFDEWWLQTQNQKKLRPELKQSVKKHFEARGFMASKDFNKGLEDFGIKS